MSVEPVSAMTKRSVRIGLHGQRPGERGKDHALGHVTFGREGEEQTTKSKGQRRTRVRSAARRGLQKEILQAEAAKTNMMSRQSGNPKKHRA